MNTQEFDKTKIFENLNYAPEPPGYSGAIPWVVQQQIAETNGKHYRSLTGKLTEYPIPEIPVPPATATDQILMDIGCGWGRWLVAAARKNYLPVGIDFRLEFCETTMMVMRENKVKGYVVGADLKDLPFKNNVLDAVWSFSVIQHTHRRRLESCIGNVARVLKNGGFCKIEFPNRNGLRNRFGPVKEVEAEKDDYNSWCVRYYTINEYRELFMKHFDNFSFVNHSFLGIGVLDNDLKYVKDKNVRRQIQLSLFLSKLTKPVPFLKNYSDSIYINAVKKGSATDTATDFLQLHHGREHHNMNILPLLCCPITKGDLVPDEDRKFLISPKAGKRFPVMNNVPMLIESLAEQL